MKTYIANKLLELGCEQNESTFSKTVTLTQPGSQLVINGRAIQQPSQQIQKKITIEILEDGFIENGDGTNHVILHWIDIKVQQDDDLIAHLVEGLYPNDQPFFDKLCGQIF